MYILIFCSAGLFGLNIFYEYIGDYEISLPEHAAERFIAEIGPDYFNETIKAVFGDVTGEFEDNGTVLEECYISKIKTGNSLTYRKKSDAYTSDRPAYIVSADKRDLCTVVFRTDSQKTKYKFPIWKIDSVEICKDYFDFELRSVTVTAPHEAIVKINGKAADSKYIAVKRLESSLLSEFETGKSGIPYYRVMYEIDGLYNQPEVEVIFNGEKLIGTDGNVYDYPSSVTKSYSVQVPKGSAVYVNGIELNDSFISRSQVAYSVEWELEKNTMYRDRYTVNGLFSEPEFKVIYKDTELFSEDGLYDIPESERYTVEVTAPSAAELFINGRRLTEAYVSETLEGYGFLDVARLYLPKLPTYTVYKAKGFYSEPEVKVILKETELTPHIYTVSEEEHSIAYEYDLPASDELKNEHSELAESFIEAYINYTSEGYNNTESNLNTVKSFLLNGTDTYKRLSSSIDSIKFNSPYASKEYTLLEADDFVSYSDICFSCRVRAELLMTRYGEAQTYNGIFDLVFLYSNGGWKVANMIFV